jgi:hypothetical protein
VSLVRNERKQSFLPGLRIDHRTKKRAKIYRLIYLKLVAEVTAEDQLAVSISQRQNNKYCGLQRRTESWTDAPKLYPTAARFQILTRWRIN